MSKKRRASVKKKCNRSNKARRRALGAATVATAVEQRATNDIATVRQDKVDGEVVAEPKVDIGSISEEEKERRKLLRYRVRVILLVGIGFLLILGGAMVSELMRADEYQEQQEEYWAEVEADLVGYYEDYDGEIPKLEFDTEGLDAIEKKNGWLKAKKYRVRKQEVAERIARLRKFAEIRAQVGEFFQEGILRSDVDMEEIEGMQGEFDELEESYRGVLQVKMEMIRHQYREMTELATVVAAMFTDEKMETVKEDLTREEYDTVRVRVDSLPQRDIAEKYVGALTKADEVLAEREREQARIAEEARRKAEEEYRQRQAAIAAAWRILNVPYWSQNGEGVKNGCEAAALLMGLQYKGYLGGMNLRTYAEMMPKSDDPFTGFRGDIFGSAGDDAPFWIAPGPLAAFGRESSGANVIDITGSSLDALDAEVAAGNPVVIYLTLGYVAPRAWRYGAPANLHVMLLTGYNSMTGMQRVTDPLTIGGKTYYDLPRAQVETILNATGNRAVVIR